MCTSSVTPSKLLRMPGGQSSQLRGLAFAVSPTNWHRRRLRFPFYFEQTNYSFNVVISRVEPAAEDDPWPDNKIRLGIRYENGDVTERTISVPTLEVGEVVIARMTPVYVAHPGQTMIVLLTKPQGNVEYMGLYSYRVRTEESLWLSIGVGLFGVTSILAAVFVPICAARMDKPPVVNINNIIQVQTPLPTFTPTPLPPPG